MPTRNLGIINIPLAVLTHLLHLPDGMRVDRVMGSDPHKNSDQMVVMVVEGGRLPAIEEGFEIPVIDVRFVQEPPYGRNGHGQP
jgi:hypothetical protein